MSDSHGLLPVQGLRLMSMTNSPPPAAFSPTGSSLRFLQGVGVYSKAMTTLPSMDGGGAPDGRVGGVCGGSAAICCCCCCGGCMAQCCGVYRTPAVSFKLPVVRQRFRELRKPRGGNDYQ